jgi:NAD(P)-dependent dehydrogenase (short-subunit alcohol dehydrogenase family)
MTRVRWSPSDMPPLAGRTAVVTGANNGLGLETARALAAHGAAVVLAVRAASKGEAAAADIRSSAPGSDVAVQELDLASLASIRVAAATLRERHARIDVLVNNAGVMWTPRSATEDGFELQFGVNHLGHFAFTGLLLDRLLAVDGSRIVTVSSVAHRFRSRIDLEDLTGTREYHRVSAYTRSKLANLLFTYELQRRLVAADAATTAFAAHPGWCRSDLARNSPRAFRLVERLAQPLAQTAAMGARPTLRAATDPAARGGEYYGPGGIAQLWGGARVVSSNRDSYDRELARRLWSASEALTGVTFPL